MAEPFPVRASAGSLRGDPQVGFAVDHAWTDGGIVVEAPGTGAHLLHAAVGVCVLNDLYREADRRGLTLAGVAVRVEGGFALDTWQSTGITYDAEVDADLDDDTRADLLATVDGVAEIPRALRAGTAVGPA